ncbi:MAG: DUF1646 family protein [Clostridiales bacterium]|nr:DUF1646 domain-containing protein [Eubacteriales bacterium]MDH7567203.1 DUF1646 family protein [Clostridiales bacterium]
MLIGLIVILLLTLTMPFCSKRVERNLEIFIFLMGLAAVIVSGSISLDLIFSILQNHLLYLITGAVFITGLLFKYQIHRIVRLKDAALKYMPPKVLIFLVIVLLGLASSVITAIVASLILVEIVGILPLSRKDKISLDVVACFSIGLGAVLTPVGEPLATITTSRLDKDFFYLAREIGIYYIIPGILLLGLFGALLVGRQFPKVPEKVSDEAGSEEKVLEKIISDESYGQIAMRTAKIFIFIIALELLGTGFKPLIDGYVVGLDCRILYFGNMISAILDNATLAAAEISTRMNSQQIHAILMGLLISGGMLIPGNIPNIISAGKLDIGSYEWARVGVPLGLLMMAVYFIFIFAV